MQGQITITTKQHVRFARWRCDSVEYERAHGHTGHMGTPDMRHCRLT